MYCTVFQHRNNLVYSSYSYCKALVIVVTVVSVDVVPIILVIIIMSFFSDDGHMFKAQSRKF